MISYIALYSDRLTFNRYYLLDLCYLYFTFDTFSKKFNMHLIGNVDIDKYNTYFKMFRNRVRIS